MHVAVLFGSVRTNRQGIKLARFVVKELARRGCSATLVDPLEHRLPLLEMQYSDYESGKAPPELSTLRRYTAPSTALRSLAVSTITVSLRRSKICSTIFWKSTFGGRPASFRTQEGDSAACAPQCRLRSVLSELGMPTIPTTLPVGNVGESFTDEGEPLDPRFAQRSAQFFDEFYWYMQALAAQRAKGLPY